MPCKNECAIIDTIYTRSVPTNHALYMVKIAQLMIPQPP